MISEAPARARSYWLRTTVMMRPPTRVTQHDYPKRVLVDSAFQGRYGSFDLRFEERLNRRILGVHQGLADSHRRTALIVVRAKSIPNIHLDREANLVLILCGAGWDRPDTHTGGGYHPSCHPQSNDKHSVYSLLVPSSVEQFLAQLRLE